MTVVETELDPQKLEASTCQVLSIYEGSMLNYMIDLGHRNIYHLTGPQDWIEAEARMQGFLDEMSARDVPTTAPILGDWTAEFGYHAGRELLTVRDFTAIFSANVASLPCMPPPGFTSSRRVGTSLASSICAVLRATTPWPRFAVR